MMASSSGVDPEDESVPAVPPVNPPWRSGRTAAPELSMSTTSIACR